MTRYSLQLPQLALGVLFWVTHHWRVFSRFMALYFVHAQAWCASGVSGCGASVLLM